MSQDHLPTPADGDEAEAKRAMGRRRTMREEASEPVRGARRVWQAIGPGVITGAADDDPSGIATYSIAGAQFGTALLWTALVTWPLMAAVQTMCARIGMVTGRGLMSALRRKIPRPILIGAALALFAANTINVGADLAGMADAAELLTTVNSHVWVVVFGVLIAAATIKLRYIALANALKWLALVLFAYIVDAVIVGPDWRAVLRETVVPSLPHGREMWGMLVAILGTTISPYLFFWQASQEVEEEKSKGRRRVADRVGATPEEIRTRKLDVGAGTLFSNLAMYFIILATALTLHRHGMTHPATSRDVAEALTPLAGRFAAMLYTVGLVGTGVLAIPTLAGSAAYAFAEVFGWRQGMDELYPKARAFYSVFIVSIALGVLFDFVGIDPVRGLYWTAVLNGLLAPFLLIGVLIVASDAELMAGQPSSRLGRGVVLATTLAMFGAAIGMFFF
ncbi:MAG: divalent metal cation transporter [Gemmatimonadota bacterium]|nr:divalent metal cation transporter [Gemmatimonadota bacterium]